MTAKLFDKETMKDQAYSMSHEYLITSGKGAYASSTISGCNTRKYHGLLIVQQPQIDENDHIILSTLDETVNYKGKNYELGIHQFPYNLHPQGYQYLESFFVNPIPKWIYRVDDVVIIKEILPPSDEDVVLIRYTVQEAKTDIELRLAPFLAFRSVHQLSRANLLANKKINEADNGIKVRLYSQYSDLYLQTSTKAEFIPIPDWFYNIEYLEEQKRGYYFQEDLFVPGYFGVKLKKGDQLVVSAGLESTNVKNLKTRFTKELKKKTELKGMEDCLTHAASQFMIKRDKKMFVKAGYHWFSCWGRDTFIALPGLTLTAGNAKDFKTVIDSMLPDLKNGLLPNIGTGRNAAYNSVDASLWFIWALQKYASFTKNESKIWPEYNTQLTSILNYYSRGTLHNVEMDEDGLIYAGAKGVALTWMDAVIAGKPVTPRIGKDVEINALWYNAIRFCLESARLAGDKEFIAAWESYPEKISHAFLSTFWDEGKGYLADYVTADRKDWSVRPNQVFAVSLPYSMLPENISKRVIEKVKDELLTPRGLRTLSPKDPAYHGTYDGDQAARDSTYHQGTVWPWLLGHFAEAFLKTHGEEAVTLLKDIYNGFKPALEEKCLYSISEIYDGDEPHIARGAISQAWSVAELLRVRQLISEHKSVRKEVTTASTIKL